MLDRDQLPGDEPVVRRVDPADADKTVPEPAPKGPKRSPRQKITPEEVEARFAARRAEREARKANRAPREMGKLVRVVVASALGIGIVCFGLGINNAGEQHAVEVKVNEDKAATLTGALGKLDPTDDKTTKQKLVDGIAAAQKRSGELAAAQQQFAGIFYAGNSEPSANNGTPKPSALKSLEHRKVIAGFFDPESLILTDDQAYSFRTQDLLEPGKIDPRLPWYTRYEPAAGKDGVQKVADPASYAWKTAAVTLSGTPDVLSVVFTNSDVKTGELLAWATARYSVKDNTFNNLSVSRTSQGESQQLKVDTVRSVPGTSKGGKA
jgi:hypothetical protein